MIKFNQNRIYDIPEIKKKALDELEWIEDWAKTKRKEIDAIPDNARGWKWTATMYQGHKPIVHHFNNYVAICGAIVVNQEKNHEHTTNNQVQ